MFLKNCVHDVRAFTVTSVTIIPCSAKESESVSNIHGVSFAIAGFIMPKIKNRIQKNVSSPLLIHSKTSFFKKAINDFTLTPPP